MGDKSALLAPALDQKKNRRTVGKRWLKDPPPSASAPDPFLDALRTEAESVTQLTMAEVDDGLHTLMGLLVESAAGPRAVHGCTGSVVTVLNTRLRELYEAWAQHKTKLEEQADKRIKQVMVEVQALKKSERQEFERTRSDISQVAAKEGALWRRVHLPPPPLSVRVPLTTACGCSQGRRGGGGGAAAGGVG